MARCHEDRQRGGAPGGLEVQAGQVKPRGRAWWWAILRWWVDELLLWAEGASASGGGGQENRTAEEMGMGARGARARLGLI